MFEAYSHSNHEGLIAASCIKKEVRFVSLSDEYAANLAPVATAALPSPTDILWADAGTGKVCQEQTHAPQQKVSLLDDLVGTGE